ncbi:MAG TPA: tripartite tricarboxylate transporter substrate binding protein [Burkholderiales bacterium]|nr:tripartite tricarboxylate transporter substrate binding protein [Burkholderiales bacterium]
MSKACFVRRCAEIIACIACVLTTQVSAQSFPSKQLEFIVHTSPGGGTDVFARAMGEMLNREKLITQPILVVNRVGGGGAIAFNHVKSKRGDPYTVLTVATGSLLSAAARTELNLGLENYTPIAFLAMDPQVISVAADSKFKTMKELIEAGRREPNSMAMAVTTSLGVSRHLLYLLDKETGAKFKFVAFKGGSEAVTAVAGGHVHFTAENLSEMYGHVESKRLRVLAVTGEKRLAAVPGAPTLLELGFPMMVLGTGRGFAMPAGVPKEAAATMEAALRKFYQTPAWKEFAARNMYEEKFLGSAEFAEYMQKRNGELREFLLAVGAIKP